MFSIRTKLITIISLIIILSLSITGYYFIDQKSSELTMDVFRNARSFSELTAHGIIDNYKLYYQSQSFSFYQREIKNIFALNSDIKNIQIADYEGGILYDYEGESEKQYVGEQRLIKKNTLKERVQDIKPSIETEERIIYFMKRNDGTYKYVDKNENKISGIKDKERVINIVYPHDDNKHRIIYTISYKNLEERIWDSIRSIGLILVFICAVGIIIAIIFANRIISPLRELSRGVLEIAKGNFHYQVLVKTKDEIEVLARSVNKMAKDLDISTKAMIEKEKISKELEIAGNIQQNLLPKTPKIKGLDIIATVNPAEEVGGDCYDFLQIDKNNALIYIGDVTGHGVPASLVVAISNALFFTMTDFYKNTKDIIIHTNKILKAKTEPIMFITAVLCNWNYPEREFTFTQAGHEQIIHYHHKSKKLSVCPSGGMALGMLPDISSIVKENKIILEINDVLILYSDGIPEAWKSPKDMLGMPQFLEIVQKHCHLKISEEIHDAILKDVYDFMGGYPQADDITLIVIRRVE